MQVRHARVEDHDDLLPIVAAAAAGPCPSLATLPQSCQPDEPFALTRLINSRDSQNLVLVAEEDGDLVSSRHCLQGLGLLLVGLERADCWRQLV